MASANINGTAVTYRYNSDGLRSYKKVGTTEHEYQYLEDKLVYEKNGNLQFHYRYDAFGNLAEIRRVNADGSVNMACAVCNSFGDVIELRYRSGGLYATYKYDTWGKLLGVYDANGNEITGPYALATQNPFRYRGYYYDTESGLYYLNGRYYDPVVCRFISPDSVSVATASLSSYYNKNLYAYCDNNPVIRADHSGEYWHVAIGAATGGLIGGISSLAGQAVSGEGINWAEVGVSAASGALTGAITTAFPGMGVTATGIIHGAVGAGTYIATELVNERTPTVAGTLTAGVTSGVLAGGVKAVGNLVSKGVKIQKIGRLEASNHPGDAQLGVKYQINKANGRPTIRSMEFHYNHAHKDYKPHWQQNSWNPRNNSVSSMYHWSWWGKRI